MYWQSVLQLQAEFYWIMDPVGELPHSLSALSGWLSDLYLFRTENYQATGSPGSDTFGKYAGTLKDDGFYFVNPFSSAVNPAAMTRLGQSHDVDNGGRRKVTIENTSLLMQDKTSIKKISLKVMTLNTTKQKLNDALGNPVEIGVAVVWRVVDTAKAVFNVDNYKEYLSLQCDAAVRNIVRIYPYDVAPGIDTTGDGEADEGSLRGSSGIVAERVRQEIQDKVEIAGLEVLEARITYLAYATEIASVMLQRQGQRNHRCPHNDSGRGCKHG